MVARKLPPTDELVKMVRRGMTHQEIAERVSQEIGEPVARVTVTAALRRAGVEPTQPRYEDVIPWVVSERHQNEWPVRMLRLLGRQRSDREISDKDEQQLNRWLAWMHHSNTVVGYCPSTDPGFWYVTATESRDEPDGVPIRPRYLTPVEVGKG